MASSEQKYEVVEYPCHICNFTSTHKHDLLKHLKSKHLSIQMYYCYHCDYKSRDKGDLLTHTKSKHKRVGSYMNTKIEHKEGRLDPKATEKQTIFSKLPLQVKRDRVIYPCDQCEYRATKKNLLSKHLSEHKDANKLLNQCDMLLKTFKQTAE